MPPIRLLVINADDLGFAPGVNRGILEAHAAGTVSSASMMVTAPAFDDAVERVRTEAPKLGVGLHLDLVAGRPLTSAPSLHPIASCSLARRTSAASRCRALRTCVTVCSP